MTTSPEGKVHITKEVALQYVTTLRKQADKDILKKVYLFGSLVIPKCHRRPSDMDIVVEVSEENFRSYVESCVDCGQGFHFLTLELFRLYNIYYDYESPATDRLRFALQVIGIVSQESRETLARIIPPKQVDMLCLPVGWQDLNYAHGLLHEYFGVRSKDRDILSRIATSAKEV